MKEMNSITTLSTTNQTIVKNIIEKDRVQYSILFTPHRPKADCKIIVPCIRSCSEYSTEHLLKIGELGRRIKNCFLITITITICDTSFLQN